MQRRLEWMRLSLLASLTATAACGPGGVGETDSGDSGTSADDEVGATETTESTSSEGTESTEESTESTEESTDTTSTESTDTTEESTESTEESTDTETDTTEESTDTGPPPADCNEALPIFDAEDNFTGWLLCENGAKIRSQQLDCAPIVADSEPCVDPNDNFGCSSNDECGSGLCVQHDYGCGCYQPCTNDADCGGEYGACICQGVIGITNGVDGPQCATDNIDDCKVNADCPSGMCGVSVNRSDCDDWSMLSCYTGMDECYADAHCGADEYCAAGWGDNPWTCEGAYCPVVPGRPLIDAGGSPVLARLAEVDPSPAEARSTLTTHYLELALLEHASVASFARVGMQLTALGAPPWLLRAVQAAALDELEHARLAFALAERFAGRPLEPGALPLAEVPLAVSPERFVDELIRDACVNETLAAAEAQIAADHCEDAEARAFHSRVAVDELAHARLGWETLAWLCERHPELRGRARVQLARALRQRAPERSFAEVATLGSNAAFGVLSPSVRAEVHATALRTLVAPAAELILGA